MYSSALHLDNKVEDNDDSDNNHVDDNHQADSELQANYQDNLSF